MSAEHARCMCHECAHARAVRAEAAVDIRHLADHRVLVGLMSVATRSELELVLEVYEEGRW